MAQPTDGVSKAVGKALTIAACSGGCGGVEPRWATASPCGSTRSATTIPPQSGKTFRLRKKGFPAVDGSRHGDQLVTVAVETPTQLTERQEELLREFAEISDDDVQPHRRSFMDRMKDLFS
ncbi:MAG: DnaJ C-terminal domain-containing protein [Myxococcota bacterium]